MKPELESIQIWTGERAPEYYRQFFPITRLEWIAVVPQSAIREFRHHLFSNGYRVGINILRHALADGRLMFCGLIADSGDVYQDE